MKYDFVEKEKEFESNNLEISGSLVIPEKERPPIILLLPGSGSVDRNENGSTLFRKIKTDNLKSIAYHLAKKGYASFRYDKRGVGKSKSGEKPGFHDLVKDSKKAIEFIQEIKEVDSDSITVLGHSEGGVLGMILASEKKVDNYIGVCSPINSLDEELARQVEFIYRARGKTNKEAKEARKAFEDVFDLMKEHGDWSKIPAKEIKKSISSLSLINKIIPSRLVKWIFSKQINPQWFIESFEYDFKEIATKINCPCLLIYGEKDYQVPPKEGEELKEIVQGNGNQDVTLKIISGLNHLLRPNPQEMSPKQSLKSVKEKEIDQNVLKETTNWLNKIYN